MTTKENILFVHHEKSSGGAARSLYDLILQFLKKGRFNCFLIAPEGYLTNTLSANCNVEPLSLIRFKRTINPLCLLKYAVFYLIVSARIMVFCKKHNISVVYANSLNAFLYCLMARAFGKICLVLHLRDRIPSCFPKWLIRVSCRKVICISAYIENQVNNVLPSSKHCVIYNGIDPNRFTVKKTNYSKVVGYAGQIIPWKRVDLLIASMKLITQTVPDVQLLIAGADLYNDHPDYLNKLKNEIVRLGLNGNVRLCGWLEDISVFLSQIDILVLPSEGEPFGRILIEAMATGVPVVGVNSGAIPEIIDNEKTGLLCESSAKSISESVLRLFYNNELRADLIDNGRTKVKNRFNIINTAESIHKIVEGILTP